MELSEETRLLAVDSARLTICCTYRNCPTGCALAMIWPTTQIRDTTSAPPYCRESAASCLGMYRFWKSRRCVRQHPAASIADP